MMTFFEDADVVATLWGPPETTLHGHPKPGLPRRRVMLLLLQQACHNDAWWSEHSVKDYLVAEGESFIKDLKVGTRVYGSSGLGPDQRIRHGSGYFERLSQAVRTTVREKLERGVTYGLAMNHELEVCMLRCNGEVLAKPWVDRWTLLTEVSERRVGVASA